MKTKRVQLHVSPSTIERIDELAESIGSTRAKVTRALVEFGLEERESLIEAFLTQITNAIGRVIVGKRRAKAKKPAKKEYLQVVLNREVFEELETCSMAMEQTVARFGGWILECGVRHNEYFLQAFGPVFKRIHKLQQELGAESDSDGLAAA